MYDWVVLWEWVEIAARWLHVITAVAWIGSSFYFIALDLGLHRDRNLASGALNARFDAQAYGERLQGPFVFLQLEIALAEVVVDIGQIEA